MSYADDRLSQASFMSPVDAEEFAKSLEELEAKFEFVERTDGIDTYREKATGKLVYHARRTETAEEVFAQAFDTVWRLRREPGLLARNGDEASTRT